MSVKLIATVCLFSGIDRELTYEVDERLANEIQAGSMVLGPLRNMTTSAIVKRLEYADTSQWEFKLRKIYSFVQPEPVLSPDLIEEVGDRIVITCDCRIPAPLTLADLMPTFEKFNLGVTTKERHTPVMVEKDGAFVQTLLNAYNHFTGENAQPISQGGSTFAGIGGK